MEIPLQAKVECTDGICGTSVYVLINPVIEKVMHLVVQETAAPQMEYIVSVDLVSSTKDGSIQLRCTRAELEKMQPFIQTNFVAERVPNIYLGRSGGSTYGMGGSYYWPYVTPEKTVYDFVENSQIPVDELAIQRGTRVEATDGLVGHVDEFVVNPENGFISHLVMREGHLWGQKDILIPLSAITKSGEEAVFLKLDKHQIEALPTFPLRRHF